MNKRRLSIATAILIIAYGGFTWFFSANNASTLENGATLTVSIVSPEPALIHERINVTGTTIPREAVVVISELSGVRILDVSADVGDSVKKDQILAQLDATSLDNQVNQLKSDYDRLHDEFKRVDAIKSTGYISQELLVQKRTLMDAAKAKLDDATLNVARATIRAPAAGIIFERNAAIGALVSVNEPLYRIAREGEIEIEAQIPEAQLAKLALNQEAKIVLSGRTETLLGHVRLITPQINNASRTASIRLALAQPEQLPVGLFTQVEIELGEVHGVLLPATVLQQDTLGFYVWTLDQDNKTVRLPVEIKLRSPEGIVFANIPLALRIVARAGVFLKEGERVNVVETP